MSETNNALAHASMVAKTLLMCAQHMKTPDAHERFAELGQHLSGLVTIVQQPGRFDIAKQQSRTLSAKWVGCWTGLSACADTDGLTRTGDPSLLPPQIRTKWR
jgi:hypothetical protein